MLNINLPPRLPLYVAIAELGFDEYPFQSAYNMLCSLAGEGLVKIRFRYEETFDCQLEKDGVEPAHFHEDGSVTQILSCGATTSINTVGMNKDVFVKNLRISDTHSVASISSIICEGESYLFVDETQMFIKSITYPASSLYVRTSELQQYLETVEENQTKTTAKSQKTKKPSIQSQREEVLEGWLLSQSVSTKSSELDFQKIYSAIGSPTKSHIWKQITRVNPKLFEKNSASSIKDFFHKWGHIAFLYGTGKGR